MALSLSSDDGPPPLPMPLKRLEYHATVHDMPSAERPRERLHAYGPQALSNAELLAIILRTGTARDNALELASKLLTKYSGLSGLLRTDFGELCREHGLGEAKCCQIKAALELGKRLGQVSLEEKYQIKSPKDAAALVMIEMMHLDHEQMRILVLDTKNQVVENVNRYQGTIHTPFLQNCEKEHPAYNRMIPVSRPV